MTQKAIKSVCFLGQTVPRVEELKKKSRSQKEKTKT